MLVHQTCLRCGLVLCALSGLYADNSLVYGQGSFLEKLEAAVRDRLAEPNPPPSDSANEEELPTPQTSSQQVPGETSPSGTSSILDGRSSSLLPSGQAVPPLEVAGQETVLPTPAGRIYLGLEAEEVTGGGIGVRVSKITEGSPAWKSGFHTGDRITAINGFAIADLDSMVAQLGKSSPGETVKFLVNRNDRNIELITVLMDAGLASRIAGGPLPVGQLTERDLLLSNDLPSNRNPPAVALEPDELGSAPWLGVIVNDLTPEFRRQFGLTVFRGAAVTSVSANSPTSKIGLMAGDAIIAIGGIPIETARDLSAWMSTARPGQTVELSYQRGSTARTLPLTLETNPQTRSANRTPVSDPSRQRSNRASGTGASLVPAPPVPGVAAGERVDNSLPTTVPRIGVLSNNDVVPNALENPVNAAAASEEAPLEELAALRREVNRLRGELDRANQRLESTQNRLKQILEGLGKE